MQYEDTYTADTYVFLTQGLLPHIHGVRYVHEEFAEEAPDKAFLREPMLEGHAVYLFYSVYLLYYVYEELAEEAPDEALLREPMLEGHAVYLLYSVYLL